MPDVSQSQLGKASASPDQYAPEVLFAVARSAGRERLGIGAPPPFSGVDVWTAHELSWLDARGKPVVAVGEFTVPADSPSVVESKSMKLYLNSLHNSRCGSLDEVGRRVAADLGDVAGARVGVRLLTLDEAAATLAGGWSGVCIDTLAVDVDDYALDPGLLAVADAGGGPVEETLLSHLLKSNCPVTGQPDWASVMVSYRGPRIDRESLLRYIISFRNTAEFHEHCVERMFVDLRERCGTHRLSVYARYTRRGGIDINPFRSDFEAAPEPVRLVRQ